MSNNTDNCEKLRKLHDRLIEEVRILEQNLQQKEEEGVANPIETVSIIKSLQRALSTVDLELQKCPDSD